MGEYAACNIASEGRDPRSMPALYRKLIALRRAHPAPSGGRTEKVRAGDCVLSYERARGATRLTIVLNLTKERKSVRLKRGRVLLSTELDRDGIMSTGGDFELAADRGVIVGARYLRICLPAERSESRDPEQQI